MGVPIHQPLAAIDQALLVHVHEDLDDGIVEIALLAGGRIGRARHGEGLAVPVAGGAEALQLTDDRAAGLLLLLPDLQGEGLAPHLAAREVAGLGHLALGHHLGRDAGMVGTRLPEHVLALHPVPADQDVLQRVVEGMAHVQGARHVRRRDHDGEGLGARPRIGPGRAHLPVEPELGDAGLGFGRIEGLFHGHCRLPALVSVPLTEERRVAKASWRKTATAPG